VEKSDAEALWQRVAEDLWACGDGHDHADDVSDALLSLFRRHGAAPDLETLLHVRWQVLRRRRADRK